MLTEFGEAALYAAVLISIFQILGTWFLRDLHTYRFMKACALFNWALLTIAFAVLLYVFATSDLSISLVAFNSQPEEPLFYRLSATWGNHEGSMLMWVWILSSYQGVFALAHNDIPPHIKTTFLRLFAVVMLLFVTFVLLTSNPFERFLFPATRGIGLNPILQDPALAFHPPTLYLGHVGFIMPFLFALVALVHKKCDTDWINWVTPWVFFAWSFLTLGVTLGSWWAYYELGWGGWWFWDPVENVSLLPWILGTALVHSLKVLRVKAAFKAWSVLLAILTFAMCLVGTFLVRSGMLTSIHSFAYDPKRGLYILTILALMIIPSLIFFCLRVKFLSSQVHVPLLSRAGAISLQNYGMLLIAFTLLVATLYPLWQPTVTISTPYFNHTIIPFSLPLLILMGLVPALKWQAERLGTIIQRLHWQIVLVGLLLLLCVYLLPSTKLLPICTFISALWILLTLLRRIKLNGMSIAHLGFGIALLGMSIDVLFESNLNATLKPGEQVTFNDYQFQLTGIERQRTPIYMAEKGVVHIFKKGQRQSIAYPEKRFYVSQQMLTTEVALFYHGLSQYYIVLGGLQPDDRRILKLSYHPLVSLIWLGGILMFCGGFISFLKSIRRNGRRKKEEKRIVSL